MLAGLRTKYPEESKLFFFLFKLFLIWLSWKGIIFILGRESDPIDQRFFPALSTVWEAFNLKVVRFIVEASGQVLNWIGYTAYVHHRTVWIDGSNGVVIGNYCIGMQLMYYFAMLMLVSPMNLKNKIIGVVSGILLTLFLNIFRTAGLCMVDLHYPELMPYAHDHIFNVLVFGSMLVLYYYLAKTRKDASADSIKS